MSKFLSMSIIGLSTLALVGGFGSLVSGEPLKQDDEPDIISVTARASIDAISPTGSNPVVIRGFTPGKYKWSAGHRGVDLAVSDNQKLRSATDGRVIYSGRLNDRSLVSIEHASGLRLTYEPVEPTVRKGDHVKQGETIGAVKTGHCHDGVCLHWGAKFGSDEYVDPLSLLDGDQVRLFE